MPGMAGVEFLAKLRAVTGHAQTPFLLVSGDDVSLPSDQFAQTLKKPVDKAKLSAWLEKYAPLSKAA